MDHTYSGPESIRAFLSNHESAHHRAATLGLQAQSFEDNTATVPRGPIFLPATTSYSPSTTHTSPEMYNCTDTSYGTSYGGGTQASNGFDGYSCGSQSTYQTSVASIATPELPCDFVGWFACDMSFPLRDLNGWLDHVEQVHLGGKLPRKVMCWFCSEVFDAGSSDNQRRRANLYQRIHHIRQHIVNEGKNADDMRPDWHYAEHLRKLRLISDDYYSYAIEWRDHIQYPDGTTRPVPNIDGIHEPSFLPESRKVRQERDKQFIINEKKDKPRHRRGQNYKKH